MENGDALSLADRFEIFEQLQQHQRTLGTTTRKIDCLQGQTSTCLPRTFFSATFW
jgi:hypothetical protein